MKNEAAYALIFSPHPSDPEFGIGGTVAHWTREGKNVIYVVCTDGDKGTSDPALMPDKLAKIREQEQLKAARMLGVKDVIFLHHPDLGLEDTLKFRKEILRLILMYRPYIVATCDPYYEKYASNRDHRVLGRVVLDVVWPMALAPNTYRDLLKQGFQLHKVKEIYLWQPAEPNYYCDITDTYEIKMAASHCHESQIGAQGNPEFVEKLVELAKMAGKAKGYQWGEAFYRIEVLQRL